jgi:hypothetical protein
MLRNAETKGRGQARCSHQPKQAWTGIMNTIRERFLNAGERVNGWSELAARDAT